MGKDRISHSTKTPYEPPSPFLVLPSAPFDYEHVCTQALIRHGSRALMGVAHENIVKYLWNLAHRENALTDLGYQLGSDLLKYANINDIVGRGELTELGRQQTKQWTQRLVKRLSRRFDKALHGDRRRQVTVVSSRANRIVDTCNIFVQNLPVFMSSNIHREPNDPDILTFHKKNRIYQRLIFHGKQVHEKTELITMQTKSKILAKQLLERFFDKSFVDGLSSRSESHDDDDDIDHAMVRNEIDAVMNLHDYLLPASDFELDGLVDLRDKYFHEDESFWFTYLFDVREYYRRGPSFAEQKITSEMSRKLLEDFLLRSDQCSEEDAEGFLHARFGHAEILISLANLLKIPVISGKPLPMSENYTYENNTWRGELVAPMAANLQWDIFRHKTHGDERPILVRMLYNEYPVAFKDDCEPYDTNYELFYTLDELKRCYNRLNS